MWQHRLNAEEAALGRSDAGWFSLTPAKRGTCTTGRQKLQHRVDNLIAWQHLTEAAMATKVDA